MVDTTTVVSSVPQLSSLLGAAALFGSMADLREVLLTIRRDRIVLDGEALAHATQGAATVAEIPLSVAVRLFEVVGENIRRGDEKHSQHLEQVLQVLLASDLRPREKARAVERAITACKEVKCADRTMWTWLGCTAIAAVTFLTGIVLHNQTKPRSLWQR